MVLMNKLNTVELRKSCKMFDADVSVAYLVLTGVLTGHKHVSCGTVLYELCCLCSV